MYLDICTKEALIAREDEISELFQASFGRALSAEEWRWFYVDNPTGPAYISLFYEGTQLLGHYAVVPTLLRLRGEPFIAYRSMTTMVHPDGRGRGLFTELANRVYTMLQEDNASMVYGFPNENSAPGFAKYLGWNLLPADRVVDFSGAELLADPTLYQVLTEPGDIEWDMSNVEQAKWRFNKPNTPTVSCPGLVTKPYDGTLNVLHLSRDGLSKIQPEATYRVLVPADFKPEAIQLRALFAYRFGSRVFDPRFEGASIRRELVMSDVF